MFLGPKGVIVKDRKYRLKTYKKCFIAKVSSSFLNLLLRLPQELIDVMIANDLVSSRAEGVQLGLTLQRLDLIYHVVDGPAKHLICSLI